MATTASNTDSITTEILRPFGNVGISEKIEEKTKKPSMYVVVLHNDPITPRAFVVTVLKKHFGKTEEDATRVMLLAHNHGVGAVAIFSFEIAETKVAMANAYAEAEGYPLHFSVQDA